MRRMSVGLATLALLLAVPAVAAPEEKIEVKVVKFADLDKTIKDQKGKVVLVDVWSTT